MDNVLPQQPQPDKPLRDKKLILCIEDNFENRLLVQRVVETEGYQVIEAENGLTGIEMAFAEYPDLVLLDMNLSDIDSYEVAGIIRKRCSEELMPIVGLMVHGFGGYRKGFSYAYSGVDAYISKPIGVSDLKRKVADFLEEKDTSWNKNLKP